MSTFQALPPHPADVKLEKDELYLRRRRLRFQKQRSGAGSNDNRGSSQNLISSNNHSLSSQCPEFFSSSSENTRDKWSVSDHEFKWGQGDWHIDEESSPKCFTEHGQGQSFRSYEVQNDKVVKTSSVESAFSTGSTSKSTPSVDFMSSINRPPRSPNRSSSADSVARIFPLFLSESCTERADIATTNDNESFGKFSHNYQYEGSKSKPYNVDSIIPSTTLANGATLGNYGRSISPPPIDKNASPENLCHSPNAALSQLSIGPRAMSPNYISPTSSQSSEEEDSIEENIKLDYFDNNSDVKTMGSKDNQTENKISSKSLALGYLIPIDDNPTEVIENNDSGTDSIDRRLLPESNLNHCTEKKKEIGGFITNLHDRMSEEGTDAVSGAKISDVYKDQTPLKVENICNDQYLNTNKNLSLLAPKRESIIPPVTETEKSNKVTYMDGNSNVEGFLQEEIEMKISIPHQTEQVGFKSPPVGNYSCNSSILSVQDEGKERGISQVENGNKSLKNSSSVSPQKSQDIFTCKKGSGSPKSQMSQTWPTVLSDDSETRYITSNKDNKSEIQKSLSDEDFESLIDMNSTMTMTLSRTWSPESEKEDESMMTNVDRKLDSCYHAYELAEGETMLPFLEDNCLESEFRNLEKPKPRTMNQAITKEQNKEPNICTLRGKNAQASQNYGDGFNSGPNENQRKKDHNYGVVNEEGSFSSFTRNLKVHNSMDLCDPRISLCSFRGFESQKSDCSLPSSDVSTVVGSVQSDASADTVDMNNKSYKMKNRGVCDETVNFKSHWTPCNSNSSIKKKSNEENDFSQKFPSSCSEDAFSVEELVRATAAALVDTLDIDISDAQVNDKLADILKRVEYSVQKMVQKKRGEEILCVEKS